MCGPPVPADAYTKQMRTPITPHMLHLPLTPPFAPAPDTSPPLPSPPIPTLFRVSSFYKHMLGQPLTYEDIEGVDPAYYKNLVWMLENDITDVLDLTFTAETDYFGLTAVVELVPGGSKIKVTEVNKKEYVNLTARHRMTTSIKEQLQVRPEGWGWRDWARGRGIEANGVAEVCVQRVW